MSNTARPLSPLGTQTVEDSAYLLSCHYNSESSSDDEQAVQPGAVSDDEIAIKKIPETSSPLHKIDVPVARFHGASPSLRNTEAVHEISYTGDNSGKTNATTPATPSSRDVSVEEKSNKHRKEVGNKGSDTQTGTESARTDVPEVLGGGRRYMIAVGIVALVAFLVQQLQPESPSLKNEMQHIDIFLKQMEIVKSQFPNQRVELWSRSRIHLQRHLQTAQPTEPVSLILTAGLNAQKTLRCLAKGLASAFSAALNASVLLIDGTTTASQDSDHVKMDIDSKLQGAFEGNTPVAVIHRFDELPPGSTLIFYRYCDHENAAYKKTFLIFTVLLGEEELPAKIHLNAVEEMVDDHLQRKFLSHGDPVSFDRMDRDKYGGLWSRISHLILPVAAEKRIEHQGCGAT